MKKITRQKTIIYRWWRVDRKHIKPEHIPALEETADYQILRMMGEGYTSGELFDNIHMTKKDPVCGVCYKGYWRHKSN